MITRKSVLRGIGVTVTIGALALLALFVVAGCGEKKVEGKMKVAASIVPLADFCRNVGGELVEVETMVPPGASPHTYEPTSKQMKFLSDAKVFVQNGLELDTWATGIMKKVDNPGLIIVVAGDEVPRQGLLEVGVDHEDGEEGEGQKRDHGVYNPHVWLDPNLAAYEVEAIREGLTEADPENEETYRENAKEYIEKLVELDRYVIDKTAGFSEEKCVSFHPAWKYFARRYGLEQVGVVEELPGKEPSAGDIARLIDIIRKEGVKVIFTEPQFKPKAAETIAAESGARVVLETLDPLGDPDDPETNTYLKLMKHDVGVMEKAME